MLGSGKGKKKKELPLAKEKKGMLTAEVRADSKATGQQGKASAASVRAGYGLSTICGRKSKAEIGAEFSAQSKLEMDNTLARHNRQIYQKYYDDHVLKRQQRHHIFW